MKRGIYLMVAALLVSALFVPLAQAEDTEGESLVGVLYRGWTDAECKQQFRNEKYITTREGLDALRLIQDFIQFKGPLVIKTRDGEEETDCYCGADERDNWLLGAEKTNCVLCDLATTDKSAVYYTNEEARDADDAILYVKGNDIGCRCKQKRGNEDFVGIVDGKCEYIDKSKLKAKCQERYGEAGVKVCDGEPGEQLLGVTDDIRCCCQPDHEIKEEPKNPGNLMCFKAEAPKGEGVCKEAGKGMGFEDLGICPDYDITTSTPEETIEFNLRFVTPARDAEGKELLCCCPAGYIVSESEGKCIKDEDECGVIVPGSVKAGRSDASTIKVGDQYNLKDWEKKLVQEIATKVDPVTKAKLVCYCRKNHIPVEKTIVEGETQFIWDACVQIDTCEDVFKGTVLSTDDTADPAIKVGPGWEAEGVNILKSLNKECHCPKGTVATDSNPPVGNDVCGIGGTISCVKEDELAAFMKVGTCGAQRKGEEYPMPFTKPVAFVGAGDVEFINEEITAGRLLKGAGHGLTRAVGLRDAKYLVRRWGWIGNGKCVAPGEGDSFSKGVAYAKCLAQYPCDQMPVVVSSLQAGGVVKSLGGVYWGSRAATSTQLDIAAELNKYKQAAFGSMSDAQTALEEVAKAARKIDGVAETITNPEYLLGIPGAAPTIANPEFIAGRNNLLNEITKAKKIIGAQKGEYTEAIAKLGDSFTDHGIDLTTRGGAKTSAGTLGDNLKTVSRRIDDVAYRTPGPGATPISTLDELYDTTAGLNRVKLSAIESAIGDTSGQLGWVTRQGDEFGKAIARTAKKPGISLRGARYFNWVDDVVTKRPLVGRMWGGLKKVGRFAGKAMFWYSIADGVSSAIAYTASSDLTISPGQIVEKAKVAKPFVVKTSKKGGQGFEKLYLYDSLSFNFKSSPWKIPFVTDGGLFDVTMTGDLLRPPGGIEGKTYECKCTGSTSCSSNNELTGCTCWPVANEVDFEYTEDTSGLRLGL